MVSEESFNPRSPFPGSDAKAAARLRLVCS